MSRRPRPRGRCAARGRRGARGGRRRGRRVVPGLRRAHGARVRRGGREPHRGGREGRRGARVPRGAHRVRVRLRPERGGPARTRARGGGVRGGDRARRARGDPAQPGRGTRSTGCGAAGLRRLDHGAARRAGAGGGARRARARPARHQRRGHRLLGRRGARRARQLERLLRLLRGDPVLRVRVRLRRRRRRPHDRHGVRASAAAPTSSTPSRSATRPPTARSRCTARASRRAAAVPSCSIRSWRPASPRSSARTLSADAVQRGRSLFAGREGEQIAAPAFRLVDDGLHPEGLATAPFDGEGVAQQTTPLIEDGVLRTYLFDTYTAQQGRARARPATASAAPTARRRRCRPPTCSWRRAMRAPTTC